MTAEKLDFIFPFFVFSYGLLIVIVLQSSFLTRLGEEKMMFLFEALRRHEVLGWVCFFVGGIWSAQNVWYSGI